MSVARWTDPAFVAAAHAWLRDAAAAHGIALAGPIAQPHVRPWSTVFRAPTATSAVYLKACGAAQLHEPALTELLHREHRSLAPPLIARHPTEPWLLLAEGGAKLGTGRGSLATWERVLPRYAELQRAMTARVPALLAIAVPDRRIARLPGLLGRVLADDRATPAGAREPIRALLPRIERSIAELAAIGIPPSLDHADLHQSNVLVRDGRAEIFDWGDACVGHPFCTLAVTLRFAARGAGLEVASPAIRRLRDAYLEPWSAAAPRADRERAAGLAFALGTIVHALSWYEVVTLVEDAGAREPELLAEELAEIRSAMASL